MFKFYKKIIDTIEQWSVGDLPATVINLMTMTNKSRYLAINEGLPGQSKSRISTELARYLKLATEDKDENGFYISPIVIFNGSMTDKGFYEFLKANRFKVIIFDDDSGLSKRQKGMIKDITGEARKTAWRTFDSDVEDEFEFHGSIIFNTNRDSNKKDRDVEAIKSRGYVSRFVLQPQKMAEKREMIYRMMMGEIEPNYEVWKLIRERMINMEMLSLTKEEIERIMQFALSINITHVSITSARDDFTMTRFFAWWKSFWGNLNNTLFEKGFDIMRDFYSDGAGKLQLEATETMKEYLNIKKVQSIKRLELVRLMCIKYGYSLRTSQSRVTDALDRQQIATGENERILKLPLPADYTPKTFIPKF